MLALACSVSPILGKSTLKAAGLALDEATLHKQCCKKTVIQTPIQKNATALCRLWAYLPLFGPQCYGECPLVGTPRRGDPANPPPGGCSFPDHRKRVARNRPENTFKFKSLSDFFFYHASRLCPSALLLPLLFVLHFLLSSRLAARLYVGTVPHGSRIATKRLVAVGQETVSRIR